MRVTTSTDRSLDIYEQKVVHADFGIVNFSRLMGSVFNDYSNDKVRQADSPSLQNITLVVFGGMQRKVVTDGAGDFEIDDLSQGATRSLSTCTCLRPPFACPGNRSRSTMR